MKKPLFAALVVLSATMAAFYARARLASEFAPEPAAGVDHDPGPPEASHLATSRMIAEGDRSAGAPAPDFVATADDGTTHRLADLCKDGPAVLVFIKDGCPCSRSADAFLKRVHAAGRGFVPFYGVIDGGVMVAARWAEQVNSAFPILADPDLAIIHAYHAENSAYVAFVAPGGRIEKLWAGYSDPMLRELAGRMAPWVEPGMEPLDVADAPAELYSGCPYCRPAPAAEGGVEARRVRRGLGAPDLLISCCIPPSRRFGPGFSPIRGISPWGRASPAVDA